MRQGVVKRIISVLAVGLLCAPGALAATPQEIYKDLGDNGRLDSAYTQADMQAFLQSAQVQGYGNPVVVPPVVVPPSETGPAGTGPAGALPAATPAGSAPASGVAGATKTIGKSAPSAGVAGVATSAQNPLGTTATAGTLPFTGAELGLFALVGAALLFGGLLLRSSTRQR